MTPNARRSRSTHHNVPVVLTFASSLRDRDVVEQQIDLESVRLAFELLDYTGLTRLVTASCTCGDVIPEVQINRVADPLPDIQRHQRRLQMLSFGVHASSEHQSGLLLIMAKFEDLVLLVVPLPHRASASIACPD